MVTPLGRCRGTAAVLLCPAFLLALASDAADTRVLADVHAVEASVALGGRAS
ncbi:hypothetical protein [Streptomyces seoulensis]|uniref:hypothetical protein n=1 Tax=Streptomyces seoulensis TaxID=73044 RepID=UPI0033AE3E28